MSRIVFAGWVALLGLIWGGGGVILAQDALPLDMTYVSENGLFSFRYPAEYNMTLTAERNNPDVGIFYFGDQPVWLEVIVPHAFKNYANRALGGTPGEIVVVKLERWQQVAEQMLVSLAGTADSPHFLHKHSPLVDFRAGGNAGVYAVQRYHVSDDVIASVVVLAVDLGNDNVVVIVASSPLDAGEAALESHIDTLLAIAGTLTYTPPPDTAILPTLTKHYIGQVGRLRTGTLEFSYPGDWYAVTIINTLFLMNTAELSIDIALRPGQTMARFVSPDYNMLPFAEQAAVAGCTADMTGITPVEVIRAQMLGSEQAVATLEAQGVIYTEPAPISLGSHDAATMYLFTESHDMLVLAVDLGGGNIVSLSVFAVPGEIEQYEPVLLAVADTLTYRPDSCP